MFGSSSAILAARWANILKFGLVPGSCRPVVLYLVLGLFLSGCGGGNEATTETGDATAASGAEAAPSANQSATMQRDCPASPTTGSRPEGRPVDDIVGIRQDMSYDDVVSILVCRDDISEIETGDKWSTRQTYGFPLRQLVRASNGVACSGREIARDLGASGARKKCVDGGYQFKALKDITHQISVVFMGMPGEEKVGAVWRKNIFAEGSMPTRDTLLKSLTQKYGAPHVDKDGTNLGWVFDFLQRPMSQASQDFGTCNGGIQAQFEGSQRWSSACGLTIKAALTPAYSNDLLVQRMEIGIFHHKDLYEAGAAFETALVAAGKQKKLDEAAEASSQAVTPDL